MSKCPPEYPYYVFYTENKVKRYGCQNTCDDGYIILETGGHHLCIPDCPPKNTEYTAVWLLIRFVCAPRHHFSTTLLFHNFSNTIHYG